MNNENKKSIAHIPAKPQSSGADSRMKKAEQEIDVDSVNDASNVSDMSKELNRTADQLKPSKLEQQIIPQELSEYENQI